MRCDASLAWWWWRSVATHVRTPGYSCTSPSRLRIPDRTLASSHRQHETTCRTSIPSCLDSLPACSLPPLLPRGLRIVSTSSLDRALEQRGATLVPVGTPRRYQSGQCRPTVLFGVSCSCYFLSVRKPSKCLPTCSFVSLSLCHLAHSPTA